MLYTNYIMVIENMLNKDMKKGICMNIKWKNIIVIVFLVLIGYKVYDVTMEKNYDEKMGNIYSYMDKINIEIPLSSKVLEYDSSSKGIQGDGESYAVIQISEDEKNEFIENALENKWKEMPLPKEIEVLVFGGENKEVDFGEGLFNIKDFRLSGIKNGIYYFEDRFAKYYPEQKDIPISERSAYNFTLAMFDRDENKLYIFELDT